MKEWTGGAPFMGVVIFLLGVIAAPNAFSQTDSAQPPNIVLIVLDALRADRLGAERNGVPLMPNLERFAEESLNFTRAVSPCSWTRPAVASIFTSLYVDAHRVHYMKDPNNPESKADALPKTMETMASYLKEVGYATVGIQTNGNLDESFGFAEGFDTYDFQFDARADWVTMRALEEMGEEKGPLFLYVHYMDPHEPYNPPERYRTMLGCPTDLNPTDTRWITQFFHCAQDMGYHMTGRKVVREVGDPSPRGKVAIETRYDGEVKFLDDELGKFLEQLAKKQNTLVIITADHGEEFWDHGFLMHSLTLYEEQLHVPLVIRGPGIEPRQAAETVQTLDILPTIADLLNLPYNLHWQGTSLFSKEHGAHLPAYAATRSIWPSLNIRFDQVQVGDLKLILDRATGEVQLYNLDTDPLEKVNLAPDQPDHVAELRVLLEKHALDNAKRAEKLDKPAKVDIDPALSEKLRDLGYL